MNTRSFRSVVLTHFFTTMNDNFYKVLLVLFLLKLVTESSSFLTSSSFIVGATTVLFVLPFLVLASFSGSLSDKYSKSRIIFVTRLIEVGASIIGVICFYYGCVLGCYLILCIMGIHTAIFSPAKFGILPELVPINKLSNANGIMTSVTYMAGILGTFAATLLIQITHYRVFEVSLVCIFLSSIGLLVSLGIKKTFPQSPESHIKWEFLSTVVTTLCVTSKRRFLLSSMLLGAFFFFLATNMQLNILPFVKESLGADPYIGGYLLVATSLGIGLGAVLAGRISKNEIEIALTPLTGIGLGLCLCLLYLFHKNLYALVPCLFFLGIFGGAFVVPLHAFIQYASPKDNRGRNLAVSNFLDFSGMLLASFSVFLFSGLFHFQVSSIFGGLGIFVIFFSLAIMIFWGEQVLRFIFGYFSKYYGEVVMTELPDSLHNFFLAKIANSLEACIILACLPKKIRLFLSPSLKRFFIFKCLSLICPGLFLKIMKTVPDQVKFLKERSESQDVLCFVYEDKDSFGNEVINTLKKNDFWIPTYLKITEKQAYSPSKKSKIIEYYL